MEQIQLVKVLSNEVIETFENFNVKDIINSVGIFIESYGNDYKYESHTTTEKLTIVEHVILKYHKIDMREKTLQHEHNYNYTITYKMKNENNEINFKIINLNRKNFKKLNKKLLKEIKTY